MFWAVVFRMEILKKKHWVAPQSPCLPPWLMLLDYLWLVGCAHFNLPSATSPRQALVSSMFPEGLGRNFSILLSHSLILPFVTPPPRAASWQGLPFMLVHIRNSGGRQCPANCQIFFQLIPKRMSAWMQNPAHMCIPPLCFSSYASSWLNQWLTSLSLSAGQPHFWPLLAGSYLSLL